MSSFHVCLTARGSLKLMMRLMADQVMAAHADQSITVVSAAQGGVTAAEQKVAAAEQKVALLMEQAGEPVTEAFSEATDSE